MFIWTVVKFYNLSNFRPKWRLFGHRYNCNTVWIVSFFNCSGMELVWIKEFGQLFSYCPNIWYLQPVEQRPTGGNEIHTFVDSAKVRFSCEVRKNKVLTCIWQQVVSTQNVPFSCNRNVATAGHRWRGEWPFGSICFWWADLWLLNCTASSATGARPIATNSPCGTPKRSTR